MKKCNKCNEYKPSTNEYFANNWKSKDGLDYYCKECNNSLHRERYKNADISYKNKINKQREALINRNKEYIYNYLSSHPCIDCGESRIVCLEFDHVFGTKENSLCELTHNACSIKKIQNEIDKCEVRCANCHRIKTSEQFGYYRSITKFQKKYEEENCNTIIYDSKIITRFYKHVVYGSNDNSCNEWVGATNQKKFPCGVFRISKDLGTIMAHRFSFEINFGEIPDGYMVNHTCNNTLCVNPKHLCLGTKSDNAKLRELKRKGKEHHNSKLTKDQIEKIKLSNLSQSKLAKMYDVSRTTIRNILTGKSYKRIT